MEIDHRRNYVLMLDTETANTIQDGDKLDMSNVLCYDIGFAVIDTAGNLYETHSFVNRDIFCYERELMQTAYYAQKIPRYLEEIQNGSRILADLREIRQTMLEVIQKYGIKYVCAHNARFDYKALNVTRQYVTKSKYRYWFPFDSVEWWDTLSMARDIMLRKEGYKEWCKTNGYISKQGRCSLTAENIYRYISGKQNFSESHTGLEDVLIEAEILWYCFRQHKPMKKELFQKKEFPPNTEFQLDLLRSIKEEPTLAWG